MHRSDGGLSRDDRPFTWPFLLVELVAREKRELLVFRNRYHVTLSMTRYQHLTDAAFRPHRRRVQEVTSSEVDC